jgi:hypothetical protein
MKIVAYSQEIQKAIGSKTEPAPWLHLATTNKFVVAIYVWDTREIIETLEVGLTGLDKIDSLGHSVPDSRKPLKGKNAELFQFQGYKITSEKVVAKNGGVTVKWFINGHHVNTSRKFRDSYCSIKNGRPSNIRDTSKVAMSSSWHKDGITKVFPDKPTIPKDDYHDTTWGYTGSVASKRDIQGLIEMNQ